LTTKFQQHTNNTTTVFTSTTITAQTDVALETTTSKTLLQTLQTFITRFTTDKEQAIVHYLVEGQNNYPTTLRMVEVILVTTTMLSDHL
jgi:hypothetical protein